MTETDLLQSVGLALRGHRRTLGLSQRKYAALRGWSKSRLARLESGGARSLRDLVDALAPTGFELRVAPVGDPVLHWESTDLVARDRAGKRFPAHREVQPVAEPPVWWWQKESSTAGAVPPDWTTEGSGFSALLEELLAAARAEGWQPTTQSQDGTSGHEPPA